MRFIYKFEAMTTPCEVTLITADRQRAEACAKAMLTEAKRLENKYNYYDPGSYLSKINQRRSDAIDAETRTILQRAGEFYRATNGIFDITVATVKPLYASASDNADLAEKKAALLPYMGCEHFSLKKRSIVFDNPHTKIDLGGYVKELAVDRAAGIARRHGIPAALINFGGDIYALGRHEDGSKFRIGIKDPSDPARHIAFFDLENEALATSASYERNYTVGGTTHSHIIATRTQGNPPLSATVIAPTCVECGVYATALMIDPELPTPFTPFIVRA